MSNYFALDESTCQHFFEKNLEKGAVLLQCSEKYDKMHSYEFSALRCAGTSCCGRRERCAVRVERLAGLGGGAPRDLAG